MCWGVGVAFGKVGKVLLKQLALDLLSICLVMSFLLFHHRFFLSRPFSLDRTDGDITLCCLVAQSLSEIKGLADRVFSPCDQGADEALGHPFAARIVLGLLSALWSAYGLMNPSM
jgi:hypothetical protein